MPMDKFSGQKRAAAHLFPPIDPFDQRMLDVGDGHQIYVEQCGNPDGAPVIVLHGGPGGGCSARDAAVFQPRGLAHHPVRSARLRPVAAPCQRPGNTTWHLVADIERIRHTLGIERWAVFGGSWGATLGLSMPRRIPTTWPISRCAACSCPCSGSLTGSTAAARGSSGRTNGRASSP
jgi:proline iminopeptidase